MCYCAIVKIKFLKECEAPADTPIHPGNGCDCSMMMPKWFYEGEELDDWEIRKVDLTGLKYRVDYDIVEYP